MVIESHSPIPKVQDKKKGYTAHNIERANHARQFQNITSNLIKQNLHAVNNDNMNNLPIL